MKNNDTILSFIENNRFNEAFNELLNSDDYSHEKNTIRQIKGEYEYVKKEKIRGQINFEQEVLYINKIRNNLLLLIESETQQLSPSKMPEDIVSESIDDKEINNIIIKSNNSSKLKNELISNQSLSPNQLLTREYLQKLKDYIENNSNFKMNPPRKKHYMNISMGEKGIILCPLVKVLHKEIGIKLNIDIKDEKLTFDKLKALDNGEAQRKISPDIEWQRQEEKMRSFVMLNMKVDVKDRSKWNEQFEWFRENLDAFDSHFRPLIKKL